MTAEDYVREVYDVSYLRLVVQLLGLTGDLADAEDAVQEAFVKALARRGSFAKLDLDQRTVVVLHYLADRSIADIAAELGLPEGTIKTRLARSRALLAPLLSEPEEADSV